MKAKSINGKSPEEVESALAESMADGYMPTLAMVFMSIEQDRETVCNILNKKGVDIIGATSCGEFINGYQSKGEIAIMLFDLSHEVFTVQFEDITHRTIHEISREIAKTALAKFTNPSLIICSTGVNRSGEFFDGVALVQNLEEAFGSHRLFYGGMAGDDMTLTGSYVFTHGKETDFGIVALILDADKITMEGMAITGWKRLGISRKVTRSEENLLYSIDDKPAVEMYLKYLGKSEKVEDKDFNLLDELAFNYPFIVERDKFGETLIKSPMSINFEENALVMDMEMKEGEVFWFSVPPDFDIVEEIIDEATEVQKRSEGFADALLVFSCAGKEPALGPLVNLENEGLAEVWNSPMAGFYTYGEFGRTKKRQTVFSFNCLLLGGTKRN